MITEGALLTAFVVGLLGGVHCLGMCGGIITALSLGVRDDLRTQPGRLWILQLTYNLGRITSYMLAGAIAGLLGALALGLTGMAQVQLLFQFVAALIMLALGLYLGGWWNGLTRIEMAGSHVWRRIEPLGRRLIPVRDAKSALVLGMLWGWLPCGLVYSVLIWSLAAGGALEGALLMLGFGLGTLPNLLLMGAFAASLGGYLRRAWVRQAAGAGVILLAMWQLFRAFGVAGTVE